MPPPAWFDTRMRKPFTSPFAASILACLVSGLAACSALDVINHVSPDGSFTATRDIAYGDLPRQRMDIYRPVDADGDTPLVVFFYGGGWQEGSRSKYEFVASALTKSGIAVAIPDYRLYPAVTFPAFVEDGAAAVAWLVEHASDFAVDDNAVFVMGHSAGAHIAALIALDGTYLDAWGLPASKIRGLIGLSGPYDFLPIESGYLLDVFPAESRERSQPINFVSAEAPPTLLIHGTEDSTVRIANSRELHQQLRVHGVTVELKAYDGVGHARVVAAIAPPLGFLGDTLADSVAFIKRVLGAGERID
jgi:acetyl esterase/lipase